MVDEKKFERVLIPFFGGKLPEKACEEALNRLRKGGKLFLLHIVDTAPTRSIRYRTGQMGVDSETIKTFRKTLRKVQEKDAKEYVEEVKEEAYKHGISVEAIYVSGDPAEEVLRAIDEYSIDLVLIEQLREKIVEVFLGDEIDHICKSAPCEVMRISGQ